MAASPQTVTSNPLYLNARTLVYTAQELRKPFGDIAGVGVQGYDSFRVRQRAAGANMSVDCMTASILNRAFIRGSSVSDQGMYRVDFNSATVVNLDVSTADGTNPRIDSVYLAIEDQQHAGSNNQATVRMVSGTATGGATLDNRTGAGAAPASMSSILLADILVAASDTSITNAEIRDRRPFAIPGAGPSTLSALDYVVFAPAPGLGVSSGVLIQSTVNFDSQQAAALMFLPRRIEAATRIRFRYIQAATANTGNYNVGIYDASGRQIITSGATAYAGTASQVQNASLTITATTFDAGYYWVVIGNGAGTGSASVSSIAVAGTGSGGPGSPAANMYAYSASGGTTLPTTILAFTDYTTITGAVANHASVPVIALSVG